MLAAMPFMVALTVLNSKVSAMDNLMLHFPLFSIFIASFQNILCSRINLTTAEDAHKWNLYDFICLKIRENSQIYMSSYPKIF